MTFAAFLAAYPEFARARLVRRLSGGGTWNQSWLVSQGSEQWVVRLDTPAVLRLGLDRAMESAVLRALGEADLAPEVILADPGNGVLVTRWVPGRTCIPDLLRNPRMLGSLGALLRCVHEKVDPPRGLPPLDLGNAMTRYAGIAGGIHARRLARGGIRSWRAARPGERGAVLCHNDPVAQNVVSGPILRLIDWEFAGRGDPLFDLAVVIGHHALPQGAAGILLSAARGGAYLSERRALVHLVDAYDCMRVLWEAAVHRSR